MKRLQPLTDTEVERMRNVYASYPLITTDRHRETDAALTRKGWVEQYDDEVGTITPTDEAYGKDKDRRRNATARCVLYDDRGMVADCWRIK